MASPLKQVPFDAPEPTGADMVLKTSQALLAEIVPSLPQPTKKSKPVIHVSPSPPVTQVLAPVELLAQVHLDRAIIAHDVRDLKQCIVTRKLPTKSGNLAHTLVVPLVESTTPQRGLATLTKS